MKCRLLATPNQAPMTAATSPCPVFLPLWLSLPKKYREMLGPPDKTSLMSTSAERALSEERKVFQCSSAAVRRARVG